LDRSSLRKVTRIYVSEASLNDVNETNRKEKVRYRYKVSRLCSAGPSPMKACLGLECVYCIFIVCPYCSFFTVQAFLT
jgi:hypothetical protein